MFSLILLPHPSPVFLYHTSLSFLLHFHSYSTIHVYYLIYYFSLSIIIHFHLLSIMLLTLLYMYRLMVWSQLLSS